jgi:hypothetical protein
MQPQSASIGPTAVGDNDFASMFGWYVKQINDKMASNWLKQVVNPLTPRGARVYLNGWTDSKRCRLPIIRTR